MKIYDTKSNQWRLKQLQKTSECINPKFGSSGTMDQFTSNQKINNFKDQTMGSLRKFDRLDSLLLNQQDRIVLKRLMELQGECKIVQWQFLKLNKIKSVFALIAIIITVFGLFALKYSAWFRKKVFFDRVTQQQQPTHVYIKDNDRRTDVVKIQMPYLSNSLSSGKSLIFFYKKLKYSVNNFNNYAPTPVSYQFQRQFDYCFARNRIKIGLSNQQILKKRQKYGLNEHLVDIPKFPHYLIDVITQPFFILQDFFCFVFFMQGYSSFSIALLTFSILTTTINYILLYKSYKKIKEIAQRNIKVKVIRNSKQQIIQHTQLVPGDIYIPEDQGEVVADCMVISGDVYVNQANLTGESIPIGKFRVQNFQNINNSTMWIYQGSKILQTKRGNTFVVVIQTGFTTTRGRIIRKILNRTVKDPDMLRSLMLFIVQVVIVSMIAFFATLFLQLQRDISKLFVFFKFIDFLVSSAPPPLPIFFNLAYSLSLFRLGFRDIIGTQPQKTVQGSQLKTFCFDKTGTLTKNQVKIVKILKLTKSNPSSSTSTSKSKSSKSSSPSPSLLPSSSIQFKDIFNTFEQQQNNKIWSLFSTCHTTKIIKQVLLGDQIDKQMFSFTGAKIQTSTDIDIKFIVQRGGKNKKIDQTCDQNNTLNTNKKLNFIVNIHNVNEIDNQSNIQSMKRTNNNNNNDGIVNQQNNQCYEVLRINQFQSKFQQMSVLIHQKYSNKYFIFAKGSPQKLASCSKNIKSPQILSFFLDTLKIQSLSGLRTIAIATKQLSPSISPQQLHKYLTCPRQEFIADLQILGLVCFQNSLKNDTKETIQKLNRSNIDCKIITGDNVYIGIQTARRAGIVEEGSNNNKRVVVLDGQIKENYDNNNNNKRVFIGKILQNNTIQQNKTSQLLQQTIQIPQQTLYLSDTYIYAITNSFLTLTPAPYLPPSIKIFARIPPQNKALIIRTYKTQQINYIKNNHTKLSSWMKKYNTKIGMCGDGANDLMALREADLSIGIQATDASYGSSFTIKNMADIDYIIKQAKCTQSNIIHLYQYYGSIAMFVLICSIILITDVSYFSTAQLMYLNFCAVLLTPVMIALSKPSNQESQYVPDANMMGIFNHLVFWGNLLIPYTGVIGSWLYYYNSGDFIENSQRTVSIQTNGFNSKTQSTTLIYILVLLTTAINGFNTYHSKPWRRQIYTNYILTFLIIINLSLSIIFAFFNQQINNQIFQFQNISRGHMVKCVGIIIGVLLIGLGYNYAVSWFGFQKKILQVDPVFLGVKVGQREGEGQEQRERRRERRREIQERQRQIAEEQRRQAEESVEIQHSSQD